jgi:hypothetical protein
MITALTILLILFAGDLFFCGLILLFVWHQRRRLDQLRIEEGEAPAPSDPSLGCLMAISFSGSVSSLLLAWWLWSLS